MLIGQKVPHRNVYSPSADELKAWADFTQKNDSMARQGLTVKESLAAVRSPNWQRPDDS
jgi:hypothetical protein